MKASNLWVIAAAIAIPVGVRPIETIGVLAVGQPPGPTPELVEIAAQLRSAVAERKPGVLDPGQLRERMSKQPPSTSLTEMDRAYESARAAYARGDYAGSVRTLRMIIEALESLPDDNEAFKQWTRAVLRLAKAESDLGHYDTERAALEQLLRAFPFFTVDPALYSPRFVRQIEEIRARVKALPTQRLTVISLTKDTRVYVDGREVASAPATLTLPRGRHKISGAQGSLRTPPIQINLTDEEALVVLDFKVRDTFRPNLGPGLALAEEERTLRTVAAGRALGLDTLFTATLAEGNGEWYVMGAAYDARRGVLEREGRIRLAKQRLLPNGVTALADFLATGQLTSGIVEVAQPAATPVAPDLRPQPPGTATTWQQPGEGGTSPKKSKTLGWVGFSTGIGAVVLGGVTAWQAVSSNDSYAKAQKLIAADGSLPATNRSLYETYVSNGDASHRIAVISGVGTGVCVVATGIMAYLAIKQTGEFGPFRF